jgi:twitching motility protein PilT
VRGQLAMSLRAVIAQRLLPGARPPERVLAVELMLSTPAVATLIREGRGHQLASAVQTGRDDGMIPLERSLAQLVDARKVSLEHALAAANEPGLLRELAGRRG